MDDGPGLLLDPGKRLSHLGPMPVKPQEDGPLFFSNPDSLPIASESDRANVGLQHWNGEIAKLDDEEDIAFALSLIHI